MVAGDLAFSGTTAADAVVAELLHRADDTLLAFSPTLPQVLAPFYKLPADQQKKPIRLAQAAMVEATNTHRLTGATV